MARFRGLPVMILAAALSAPLSAWAATAAPAGDAAAGEVLVKQRCLICHTLVDDGKPHPGPNLKGVIGRKAGSVAGFAYSPALKAANLTWTPAKLNEFLAAPQTAVPGTFMVISLAKPDERANIIAYLATLKR